MFNSPLSNERLMYLMFSKMKTKIKELFNIKIVIESESQKEIEFRTRIPEYTKWVIPIKFYENEHKQ